MAGHDIIVVGASAGGIEALSQVLADLPSDLPATIFVVVHISPDIPSMLPGILSRAAALPAFHALDGARIEPGRIYIAPPDNHLLLEADKMRVVHGPRENRHRPAVDPLFRSAAIAYGPRVVGLILSGALDDGTAGLLAVKRRGGLAIVQNPDEALYSGMPRSAVEHVEVDYCLPLAEIGPTLVRLASTQVVSQEEESFPVSEDMAKENRIASLNPDQLHGAAQPGTPSAFSCPECGGVLWELQDGQLLRFRCRVGHAFSSETMLIEQNGALEEALWVALKVLEERATFAQRLAERARVNNQETISVRYELRAQQAWQHSEIIRQFLMGKDDSEITITPEIQDFNTSQE